MERPEPSTPARGTALSVTVRYGGTPIDNRVIGAGHSTVDGTAITVDAEKNANGYTVNSAVGRVQVNPESPVALRQEGLEVELTVVQRFRLPRLRWEQGDIVLPVIALAVTLLGLQLTMLYVTLFGAPGGGGGMEPSPEYIARLLDERYDGEDQGVLAERAPRPQAGEAIESFYLQPGHDGPRTQMGGGKNRGRVIRDGSPTAPPAEAAPAVGNQSHAETKVEPNPQPSDADEASEEVAPEEQIAQHITEGWGFSDWYNTEDARRDAEEIHEQLELAKRLLKLDPNDPTGLVLRGYYEYLAMNWAATKRTYEKFTRLYPDEPAGWNNLALVYKRTGDYKKEEELYRIALSLAPDDDHALNNLAVCLAHQGRYNEALAIMEQLEELIPEDAYADLHRAKIYAAMGKEDRAYHFLQKSLVAMKKLDTLHNIEFRQDIRVDPAFETMRQQERFEKLLTRYYGDQPGGWWLRRGDR